MSPRPSLTWSERRRIIRGVRELSTASTAALDAATGTYLEGTPAKLGEAVINAQRAIHTFEMVCDALKRKEIR